MAENLKNFAETKNEKEADVIVINSCTVTNGADVSLNQYLNRVSKSGKKILLTGCKVPVTKDSELKNYKVDAVFEHALKEEIDGLLQEEDFFIKRGQKDFIDRSIVENFEGRSRAFIKVQEGCDFRCSYCIIPFSRGPSRSLPETNILTQIERLAQNGYSEIVLTGTNVGSYGEDTGSNLGKLIEQIGKIDAIKRVRLGSIEPSQVVKLGDVIHAPFFNKHLHIALQHTSDRMLEIMNRPNRFETDLALFESLTKQGFALGSDMLIAHPGETESIWREAYERFEQLPLTHCHIFTFSPREGTPSAGMADNISNETAKKRYNALDTLIKAKNKSFRSQKQKLEVFVENSGKEGLYQGYDQFFNRISISSEHDLKKQWIDIEAYEVQDEKNFATF